MKVESSCMICGKKLAKGKCRLCGILVCEDHFDTSSGLCVNCKRGQIAVPL